MTRFLALLAFLVALVVAPDTPRAAAPVRRPAVQYTTIDGGVVRVVAEWPRAVAHPTLGRAGYGLTLADAAPPPPTIAPDGTLAVDPGDDLAHLAVILLDAVRDRNWWLVVSLVLSLVLSLVRKFGPGLLEGKWPAGAAWLKSDVGGAVMVLGLGLSGGFVTALAGGAPIGMALVVDALKVSLGSAGGFVLVKKLFGFNRDEVEQAGVAAVDKNPPPGVVAVVGDSSKPLGS